MTLLENTVCRENITEKIEWKPIELSDKALFDTVGNNEEGIAMFGFASLFLWSGYYKTEFAVIEGNITARGRSDSGKSVIYFPRGLSGNVRKTVENVMADTEGEVRFMPLTHKTAETIKQVFPEYELRELDGKWEYVYNRDDLAILAGKKYHAKRNHIAKFNKNYTSEYIEINKDNIDVLRECAEYMLTAAENSPKSEYTAIKRAIDNFDALGLRACVIKSEGRYVAYSIGSVLNADTADIHFEKADRTFDGSFAFVNKSFAENGFADMKYLNREEDLGIEGLRRAKLSYYPVRLNKTYSLKPRF